MAGGATSVRPESVHVEACAGAIVAETSIEGSAASSPPSSSATSGSPASAPIVYGT